MKRLVSVIFAILVVVSPVCSGVPRQDQNGSEVKKERGRTGNPAVYVEEVSTLGSISASSDTALELIKTLQKKGVRVVTIKEKADYVVQITRQLGKKSWSKDTKLVVSNRDGEVVLANSTRSVGGAADDIAEYIKKHHH